MASVFAKLRDFDAYPKTLDDFRVKTFSGAAVSIVAGLIMLVLFASELRYFLMSDVHEELFVDTSRNEKMLINVDITFPKMPCAYLHLDVMDVSGSHQLDVEHNIYKSRLDQFGKPVTDTPEKQDELGDQSKGAEHALETLTKGLDPKRCETCYGAESPETPCCNTCQAVRDAYQKKGWAFGDGEGVAQCEREGWTAKIKQQSKEGCNLFGHIEVNKVAGNFHIAPGKSFQQQHVHVHDLQSFGRAGVAKFNMTHVINRLSFGKDYPGLVNPLDEHKEVSTEGGRMYQYFVKVVPTRYRKRDGEELATNQYSVTTHQRTINYNAGETGLPGVFFMFEISPLVVQISEDRRSFLHFLTGVCAIIGGVFTVAGMIDGFIYHGLRSIKKKAELGKLG